MSRQPTQSERPDRIDVDGASRNGIFVPNVLSPRPGERRRALVTEDVTHRQHEQVLRRVDVAIPRVPTAVSISAITVLAVEPLVDALPPHAEGTVFRVDDGLFDAHVRELAEAAVARLRGPELVHSQEIHVFSFSEPELDVCTTSESSGRPTSVSAAGGFARFLFIASSDELKIDGPLYTLGHFVLGQQTSTTSCYIPEVVPL